VATWPGPAALQGTYRGSRVAVIECAIATTTNSAAPACSIEPPPRQFNFLLPVYRILKQGCLTLISKLLQPISQSHEGVSRKRKNTEGSSMPWKGHAAPPIPVNPTVSAEARKGFPSLLKRG
jgi:hypothetical protein